VSALELSELIRQAPELLGSASIGGPTRGALWRGVELEPSHLIAPTSPHHAWGTRGTIEGLQRAVSEVELAHPGSPTLYVGDISRQRGGALHPHRSHQSGRDADVGYYYLDGPAWYEQATEENLDRARTWTLVKSLIHQGDVEYIFMNQRVQALLREHAEQSGEDAAFLDEVFAGERRDGTLVRNARGHTAHFHIRFGDPVAVRSGELLHPWLKRYRMVWF
jgi:penicillin-insensitive murein endopeptidase